MGERLKLTKSRMLLGTTVLTVLLIATLYHGPVYSSSGTCDPGGITILDGGSGTCVARRPIVTPTFVK